MANYSITPCSGSTPTIIDFGATTPIVSKVYYIYFTGATSAGCYTIDSTSVGAAVDGISSISDPNNDCFACTGCTCHYVNVTIVQSEIDAASGNTGPNAVYNGIVSVGYNRCDSNYDYKNYTVAGTYNNDLCILKTQINNATFFYYQNNVINTVVYPWSGSSLFDTGSCCLDPTPTPTVTPTYTQTPTVTPTYNPTETPSNIPSVVPTYNPTEAPTFAPTDAPTFSPTVAPTFVPTDSPTFVPTDAPTYNPTETPTFVPTVAPTYMPTEAPTYNPTKAPTFVPTEAPTPQQIQNATTLFTYDPTIPPFTTTICPITLEEFIPGEQLMRINTCGHIFKANALHRWFVRNKKCPSCRHDITITP
jgi:hypothetical protein